MQTQEQAEAAAYSCVLGQAERHMEESEWAPEISGLCHTCAHFVPLNHDDQAEMLRCIPDDVSDRGQLAAHLRICLGVCRMAAAGKPGFMGVLYARDNLCDEWEETDE